MGNENGRAMYRAREFAGPFKDLSKAEVLECRKGLDRFVEGHCDGSVSHGETLQHHITLPWLYKLATNLRIVGAVRSILQCDEVMLFSSCFFLRSPHNSCLTQLGVGWHEDGALYDKVLAPM